MPFVRLWGPVLLWAALIFGLSTDAFSSDQTSRFIVPFLRWLLPEAGPETIELFHSLIRKLAHVAEYFVLGLLLFRAVRASGRGWCLRWAAIALLLAAAYAGLDEFHQALVESRGSSPLDTLLDTAGAVLAQLTVWIVSRKTAHTETA